MKVSVVRSVVKKKSVVDIDRRIHVLRGRRVMLDRDLAVLYGVRPIALRQQVKRNLKRFPPDFMFRLTRLEAKHLVSQNVIPSIRSFGGALPYVFTREGISMLSGVLRSKRAVSMNISIMRAFVRMGDVLVSRGQLAKKFGGLIERLGRHEWKLRKHDREISLLMNALRQILSPQLPPSKHIGF